MVTLKNILKTQRIKAHLTQQELADKVNITQTGYSRIERGTKNPSLKVFSKLAAILDIDMNILKDNNFDKS